MAIGTLIAAIHVISSLVLRGRAVPANMKLYLNAVILVFLLTLRLPGIRKRIEVNEKGDHFNRTLVSGFTSILCGGLILTTSIWVGNSYFYAGTHWVDLLQAPPLGGGLVLTTLGFAMVLRWLFFMNVVGLERVHAGRQSLHEPVIEKSLLPYL